MKYKLMKCSSPGWTKEFDSQEELHAEFLKHICAECIAYAGRGLDAQGIFDLLNTECGCEFDVDMPTQEFEANIMPPTQFTPQNPNPAAVGRVRDPIPIPTVCPHCQGKVEISKNSAIYNGKEYGDWPYIYLCMNKKCFASIGLHPQTDIPLGTLAHGPLRRLRMEAKNEFNPLWKSGEMSRTYAYQWLANQMKIEVKDCHFGLFDEEQCERAMEVIANRKVKPTAALPDWKQKLLKAKDSGKATFQAFANIKTLGKK